jgi:hypothetical protein
LKAGNLSFVLDGAAIIENPSPRRPPGGDCIIAGVPHLILRQKVAKTSDRAQAYDEKLEGGEHAAPCRFAAATDAQPAAPPWAIPAWLLRCPSVPPHIAYVRPSAVKARGR